GLSRGVHQITASVTDGSKLAGSATVTVTVEADRPPDVTILQPRPGQRLASDQPITFAATAVDSLDGDQSATLTWTSDRDGTLGTGGTLTRTTLSEGTHTITATVTDGAGLSASTSFTVTVGTGS